MVQVSCRARFTAQDLRFVASRLTKSEAEADALQRLIVEPGPLDEMLDDEMLYSSLLDHPDCVTISTALYFYVIVRHVMLRHGLEDRSLSDYIASLLATFTATERLALTHAAPGSRSFGYLTDLLQEIDQAPASRVFELRTFLAEYTLFTSGLFHDRLTARHSGAPGLRFYEAIGQANYRSAAAHPEALRHNVRDLFGRLAEAFHEVRLALNEISSEGFR